METGRQRLAGHTILLAAEKRSTLTLNDVVVPVLIRAGAKVLRFCHTARPGTMEYRAGFRPYSTEEVSRHNPAMAITVDDYNITGIVPDIPIAALPHATYKMPQTPFIMGKWQISASTTDFYFTQDDCTRYADVAPGHLIYSMKDIDTVTFVPLGSLKRDALARDLDASPRKDAIMLCGGHPDFPVPSWEDTGHFIRDLLNAYPRLDVIFRPFPDSVEEARPLAEQFTGENRFLFDTSPSTRTYLPRAAAVVCFASTTGQPYTMACGEPHVFVDLRLTTPMEKKEDAFVCDGTSAARRAVDIILGTDPASLEEMRLFREEIAARIDTVLNRPGQAETILVDTLCHIIEGRPLPRSLPVPAQSMAKRGRLNMLEGVHILEDLLNRPNYVHAAENALMANLLFIYLYQAFQQLTPTNPARPRLIVIDKKSLHDPEGMVQVMQASEAPPGSPLLVAGGKAGLTRPSLDFLENHPGGFLAPEEKKHAKREHGEAESASVTARAKDTAYLAMAALEMERPIFLMHDQTREELKESYQMVIDVLRILLDTQT